MSMRFSQEMVSSTLVAKFVAPGPGTGTGTGPGPGPGAPQEAMAALHTTNAGDLETHVAPVVAIWRRRLNTNL